MTNITLILKLKMSNSTYILKLKISKNMKYPMNLNMHLKTVLNRHQKYPMNLSKHMKLANNAAGPQDTRNDFSRPSDSRNDIGTDNNNARPSDSRNEHNPETDTQTEDISLFSDDHAFEAPAQSSQTTTDQMAQNMSQTASNTVDILPPRLVTSMSAFTQPMRTAQRPLSSAILQRHPPSLQKGPHRKCQEEESKWFQFPEHPNYRSALKLRLRSAYIRQAEIGHAMAARPPVARDHSRAVRVAPPRYGSGYPMPDLPAQTNKTIAEQRSSPPLPRKRAVCLEKNEEIHRRTERGNRPSEKSDLAVRLVSAGSELMSAFIVWGEGLCLSALSSYSALVPIGICGWTRLRYVGVEG
ncbi:hypothetical protein Salat_1261800 [Sesamum alatum]|uniref:Uncharacterized protein n=1 Tax=Sesamum alatum TaxID=300844 RepID=A0AAE1YGJ0_9LAMI|nr:hypothetical protein Salat_1261800 [Sesamum alatum]